MCRIPSGISGNGYRIRIVSSSPVYNGNNNGSNISIHSLPNPYINGSFSVCQASGTVVYSVPMVSGHQYEWSQIKKGDILGGYTSNTLSVQWKSPGIDTIRVKQLNPLTGCSKDTSLIITILDIPSPDIKGKQSICEQSITEYSVPTVIGHQYEWLQLKKGDIIGSNTSNTLSVQWKSTGIDTIRVKQLNPLTGCSKDTSFQVIIHSLPIFTINGLSNVCEDTTLREYSVNTLEDNEYSWRNSGLGMIKGSSTESKVLLQWNNPGIDTLFFVQKNSKTLCSKDTFIIIKINPQPNPVIIGNTEVFEQSKDIEYRVNYESGSLYEWFIDNNSAEFSIKDQNRVVLRFTKNGLVVLKVRQTTKDLCTKESSISIVVSPISSVLDRDEKLYTIFPNPVDNQGELYISCLDNNQSDIYIELMDIYGTTYVEKTIQSFQSHEAQVISLSSLSKGMYILKLRTSDKVHIEKIIVR